LNGSTMSDRLRQALVTSMLRDHHISFGVALPTDDLRVRFVADHKRRRLIGNVLLDLVNLDGGVISGGAEPVAFTQVGGVDVRARVDDEGRSADRDFDAERVVVAVRSAAVNSASARVEKHIEIVSPQNIRSGVKKS